MRDLFREIHQSETSTPGVPVGVDCVGLAAMSDLASVVSSRAPGTYGALLTGFFPSWGSSCFALDATASSGKYMIRNCILAVGSRVVRCDDTAVSVQSDNYIYCEVQFGSRETKLTVGAGSDIECTLTRIRRPLYWFSSSVDGGYNVVDMRWGPQIIAMC